MRIPSRESYRLCWMILLGFRLLDLRSSIQNRNKRCSWIYEISWWIISGRKPVQQQSPIPLSFFEVSTILSDSLKNEINHETSSWLLVYEGENALDSRKKQNIFFGATYHKSPKPLIQMVSDFYFFLTEKPSKTKSSGNRGFKLSLLLPELFVFSWNAPFFCFQLWTP